ncbi:MULTISPECIES: nucleotidyltransferase family protein [Bradyrhizobium]|uniref:nucleotidyltransferase family protein n=1 Tax=Bradyrhizobium TaxID=374 RepID=UPI00201156B3|nr:MULTISPECIES: nucleotidyltransferase family protein [Bradyrhizobium]
MSVIGLANQTLTSPALIDLVDQSPAIPEDVCAYIRNLYRRNVVRNDRLATQLEEAVLAMNDLGVTPILIKGAATLATAPRERRGVRLMADLDIVVTPEETERAVAALIGIGYGIQAEASPESRRWHMDLSRPSDVGAIDLQRSAPGPAFAYRECCHPLKQCVPAVVGRGRAYVPTPTYQALMLIIHDQFQDYGYWLGDIDLRHLVELRDLDRSVQGIDWDELCSHVSGKLMRNAVETHLLVLSELLGVDVPRALCSRTIPRLQFVRRVTQARFPVTRWPLLVMAICDLKNYRTETSTDAPQASRRRGGSWSLPKVASLQFLLQMAAAPRVGKV